MSVAAAVVLSVCVSAPAGAQEKVKKGVRVPVELPENMEHNRDEQGRILRGSYLTNLWYDNWSFGVSGGAQVLISGTGPHNIGFDINTAVPTPSLDIFTTKWFTPTIGMRAGFQAGILKENRTPEVLFNHYPLSESWYQSYAHVSLLWNVINTFSGYKLNRAVNFIPYVEGGYYRLIDNHANYFTGLKDGEPYRDREPSVGAGALVTFKLGNQIDALIDIKDNMFAGRYHSNDGGFVNNITASVGLQYTLRKWYFKRSVWIEKERNAAVATAKAATEDAERAIAAADEAKRETRQAQSALEEAEIKLQQLEKSLDAKATPKIGLGAPVEVSYLVLKQMVENADLVLYFYINHFDLNFSEEHHLDNFVKAILEEDPDHVFYLTGSADKQTGSFDYNVRLSTARANNIKKILVEKYKIPEDHVIIKQIVVSDKHLDGALDRCVIIESEE